MTRPLFANISCWMRGSYPDWVPRGGHVALVALCGRHGSPLEQKPRSARQ